MAYFFTKDIDMIHNQCLRGGLDRMYERLQKRKLEEDFVHFSKIRQGYKESKYVRIFRSDDINYITTAL